MAMASPEFEARAHRWLDGFSTRLSRGIGGLFAMVVIAAALKTACDIFAWDFDRAVLTMFILEGFRSSWSRPLTKAPE